MDWLLATLTLGKISRFCRKNRDVIHSVGVFGSWYGIVGGFVERGVEDRFGGLGICGFRVIESSEEGSGGRGEGGTRVYSTIQVDEDNLEDRHPQPPWVPSWL